MYVFLNKLIQFLFDKSAINPPFHSTHFAVLCPQNGDRIVTIDSVTSLHSTYTVQLVTLDTTDAEISSTTCRSKQKVIYQRQAYQALQQSTHLHGSARVLS